MNADLPRPLDKQTRIDTTIPGSNKLTYVYTLLGVSADDIDEQALIAYLRPSIINGYKTNPKMATLRAKDVELDYLYRDESGKHIIEILFLPKDL